MMSKDMSEEANSVHVSLREYKSLLDDSDMLRALYAAGVREWDGYQEALHSFEGEE